MGGSWSGLGKGSLDKKVSKIKKQDFKNISKTVDMSGGIGIIASVVADAVRLCGAGG